MKKFMSLVKLLFMQQYRTKPTEGRKKKGGTISVFIILGICFLPMLIGIAVVAYYLGTLAGCDAGILSILIFACQAIVLIFGLTSLITTVFSSKDADKLLFLPVRSSTIFAAKLTVAYINEVITTAVMILFLLLPFGIGAVAPLGYYPILLIALILIPLLPLLLGCIVAIPLSALIAKIGKNGIVKTVLQILMFIIIMGLYIFFAYEIGFIGGGVEDVTNQDMAKVLLEKLHGMSVNMKYVHSNFTLANAMVASTFGSFALNLLMSLGENILLLGLVLLMAMPFYHWILASSQESFGGVLHKKSNREMQVKNQGVVKELIVTDIKRVSRDGQMGFQALMNLIVLPLMVVLFYVIFAINSSQEDGSSLAILRAQPLYQIIAPLAIMGYMSLLGITSNSLGNYPISRENKSFYLIKSLPISFKKFLLAKVILATSVMLISDFLTCILVVVLFGVKWYYGIAMLATMAFLGFGGMCITTLIDLKNPKLGWTNFNQSLKNAKNSWIAMLIGMLTTVAVILVAAGFIAWYAVDASWYVSLIMWIAVIIAAAGFSIVSYKIMTANAQKNFENIEA